MMEEHWIRAWNDGHNQLSADLDKIVLRARALVRRNRLPKAKSPKFTMSEKSMVCDHNQVGGALNNES
ncbi:MAG: hypothetical protein ACKVOS_02965 [Sphingorhabdus sp.]|uniref:hypothetical protein n=1 Tax=Sphingorhabdus sp. TaxID=1902408 RepID=UPI0038FD0F7C